MGWALARTCPSELVLEVKIQCPMFENEFHLFYFSPEWRIDTCSTSIYTPGLGGKDFVFASPFFSCFLCQVQPNNVETITKTLETSLSKTVTLDSWLLFHINMFLAWCQYTPNIKQKNIKIFNKDNEASQLSFFFEMLPFLIFLMSNPQLDSSCFAPHLVVSKGVGCWGAADRCK